MKKNQLIKSALILITSLLALLSITLNQDKYDSSGLNMILGFLTAMTISSIVNIIKYIYWNKDEQRKELYERRLKKEKINLKDERKSMIRDKSGRESYLIGLIVVGISIITFMFLKVFKIYDPGDALFIYLIIYIFFQYILGIVIYNHLEKKM